MRKIILLIALAITSYGYAQNDVTFQVDMSDYSGDFTTIELNGTFNGWCGACNPMTDMGNGIWALTLPLASGPIEFKYTFDNWVGQENLTPGSSCTVTGGGNTNRFLDIIGDTIMDVVCWESCEACVVVPPGVTFQVDMSDYSGAFTTVELNGSFNDWCGSCNPMADQGNGIWAVTLPLEDGPIEFKYTFDNWTGQEDLTEGSSCTITTDGNTNRFLEIAGDILLPVVCWESCQACGYLEPIDLPIDWEGETTDYTVTDFGDNISTRVTDPVDGGNMVLQTDRAVTAPIWAGTTLSTPNGLANPIPFGVNNNIITVSVYSPESGVTVRLKAEDHTDPTKSVETDVLTTVADEWETLTFDFSNEAPGTAAINYTYTYDILSIFYNYGVDGATAGAETYYCDDVAFDTTNVETGALYCNTEVTHFGIPEEIPSKIYLTIANTGPNSMIVEIESVDSDPVDVLIVPGGSGAAISEEDFSIPGKISRTLTWSEEPPAMVSLNVLWSKVSFGGNWQLSPTDVEVPFTDTCGSGSITSMVTFKVDMNDYVGEFTTIELNGTFNEWCGACNPMADDDSDGVWEVTLPLENGMIEYKYTFDNWTGQESLSEGMPCTITADGNTNRFLDITSDVVLPVVCWESCVACGALNPIDLPIDWEGETTDYTVTDFGDNMSMRVADPINAENMVLQSDRAVTAPIWAGTTLSTTNGLANPIPFDADNNIITVSVYSPASGVTIRLKAEDHTDPTKSVETDVLTTVADEWETLTFDFSNEATGTAAINYTYTYDMLSIFYNYGVDGATAGAETYYCDDVVFGDGVAATSDVTFQVDMSDYTGDFTTIELNGTFNGWCGTCNPMTDQGDGIWAVTLPLENGPIEFKYTFDNWTGQEDLEPGLPCTITTDFTNRFLDITGDTIMPVVCWESCDECEGVGIKENNWMQNFLISPNPSDGNFQIQGELASNTIYLIRVTDLQGKVIYESSHSNKIMNQTIHINNIENGLYLVNISSDLGKMTKKILIFK